jgi:hypothetical protein
VKIKKISLLHLLLQWQNNAYLFYLEPYRSLLLNDGEYPKVDAFVKEVKRIYTMHMEQRVQHCGIPAVVTIRDFQAQIKKWLEEVIAELQHTESSKRQFISSVCIACCTTECGVFTLKCADFVYPLLKMLHIQPNMENKSCPNFSYLVDIMGNDFRVKVSAAIIRLCKEAMKFKTKEANLDWLYALPLYHFMLRFCEPFASLEYDPEKLQFNARARLFDYDEFRKKLKPGLVDLLYSSLEPLFDADPLLLYDFMYICPKEDFHHLFAKVPSYLSIARLSCRPVPFRQEDAKEWKFWLELVIQKITQEPTQRQLSVATVDAAKRLVKILFGKLTTTLDYHLDVLKTSISLLLAALSHAQVQNLLTSVTDVFGMCEGILWQWVTNHNVIGGSFFGGSIGTRYWPLRKELLYALPEVKLWQNILTLQTPQDRKITEAWNVCIEKVIRGRVDKVPGQHIIELVFVLEMVKEVNPLISTLFMEKAIDRLSTETHHGNLDAFGESRRVGELFGRLLEKRYPQIATEESINISLHDLLTWSYWPDFIKIYSGTSKAKEGLPQKCHLACFCALSQLEQVSRQLQGGDITVVDLQKIRSGQQQMERLCKAANSEQRKGDKSEQNGGQLSYDALIHSVELRLEEFNTLEKQQGFLQNLCEKIHPSIKGVSEAKTELQTDYKSRKINTLCSRRESYVDVVCFTIAAPLLSFAWKFYVMTTRTNSSIFYATWSNFMKQTRKNNPNMSIRDVEIQVWTPAFEHCQNLLDQLHSFSMTLADVDRHFKDFKEKGELVRELKALSDGVAKCVEQTHDDDWILKKVQRIEEYRKLRGYCYAANSFLKLRDSLNLIKGDFQNVERISEEASSSLKDQTLAYVDDTLVKAGKFLNEFTGEKLECIQMFCECQKIVRWIQNTTTDVSDLQNFVNVALATAAGGEDDYANDRLSNLRTVGSGFASLIYKLPEDTGFEELARRCSSVWAAYRNDRNLPKMLVGHIKYILGVRVQSINFSASICRFCCLCTSCSLS